MKCPQCGQHIFNNPEFCINCGYVFKPKSEFIVSSKLLAIIIVSFLIIGGGLVLGIMYLGTEQELKPFLNNQKEQESKNNQEEIIQDNKDPNFTIINDYCGNYIISNLITSSTTPAEIKEKETAFLGWPLTLKQNLLKVSLYTKDWVLSNEFKVYFSSDLTTYQNLFPFLSDEALIFQIEGFNHITNNNIKHNFIINNNILYLYYADTLFQLEKSKEDYQSNHNFYKLDVPNTFYLNETINNKINNYKKEFKSLVEAPTNYVISFNFKEYQINDIKFLVFIKMIGEPFGHTDQAYDAIAYQENTEKICGLLDYLETQAIDFTLINNNYKEAVKLLNFTADEFPLTNETPFYIVDNLLYLIIENEQVIINLD